MSMEALQYKLDRFEGPLDLLLSLVEKNKINIDDIPISLLCAQYMDYLAAAQAMDIALSSEFIVMASELMLIKSKMLLPRDEKTEEDPRAALAAAMLEYKRIKEASASMASLYAEYGLRMVKDTDEIRADDAEISPHSVELLRRAMLRILSEVRITDEEAIESFEPLLRRPTVTVAEVAERLIASLREHRQVTLRSFFGAAHSRPMLIALFMSMLELLKNGVISLTETEYAADGVIRSDGDAAIALQSDTDPEEIKKILKESANI